MTSPNQALHRMAIPLRSIATSDLVRSAVEVAIDKYEKTALQWLKKQTPKKYLVICIKIINLTCPLLANCIAFRVFVNLLGFKIEARRNSADKATAF